MHVITKRDRIREVLTSWERQYGRRGNGYGDDKRVIRDRLAALDLETCDESDVTRAIGNSSWTDLSCDECNMDVDAVIRVGAPLDYESSTADLCAACAKAAVGKFPS